MLYLFQSYRDARNAIAEYFNDAPIWHNVIFNLEDQWTDHNSLHDSISWELLDDPDDLDCWNYGVEIYGTSRWESNDGKYTLVIGDDGCGNRDCYVFDNALKVEE